VRLTSEGSPRSNDDVHCIGEHLQLEFARLSGDHSPLHVDPLHARRTQFGRPVVHGVHLVLRSMEQLDLDAPWLPQHIAVQFRGAITVGETFKIAAERTADHSFAIRVLVADEVRTRIELDIVAAPGVAAVERDWGESPATDVPIADLRDLRGSEPIGHDPTAFESMFPRLARGLSPRHASLLLALTRVIGMRCPGDRALFRSFRWTSEHPQVGSPGIDYRVDRVHERLGLVELILTSGDVSIVAEAAVRPDPPQQLSAVAVAAVTTPDLCPGARVLVVGGSRGLGELAAKVAHAGGAEVLLTYRSGNDDARRLVEELGDGARACGFDAGSPSDDAMADVLTFDPTHLMYFATPPILKRPSGSWDHDTFSEFVQVYVSALSRLLAALGDQALRSVLYPSSVFVDLRPDGFAEYATAKEMGEMLCRAFGAVHSKLTIAVPRLPPLATDQTAGTSKIRASGNLDVLLPILREVLA
jgi:acyl dehydratase/NAD(P)-dependent dehydrogenase (short-subunit alcohol dehydrogenase family)